MISLAHHMHHMQRWLDRTALKQKISRCCCCWQLGPLYAMQPTRVFGWHSTLLS